MVRVELLSVILTPDSPFTILELQEQEIGLILRSNKIGIRDKTFAISIWNPYFIASLRPSPSELQQRNQCNWQEIKIYASWQTHLSSSTCSSNSPVDWFLAKKELSRKSQLDQVETLAPFHLIIGVVFTVE